MATKKKASAKKKTGIKLPPKQMRYDSSDYLGGGYIPVAKTHHRKEAVIRDVRETNDFESPYKVPHLKRKAKKEGGGVNQDNDVMDRVLASGVVEAGVFAAAAAGATWFLETRKRDLYWSAGVGLASFFVAGGARNNAGIRDVSLGILAASAAVLTINITGHLKLFSGQQAL